MRQGSLRVLYLICEMALKVNYFAADKGKSLYCRLIIEAKMSLLCVYAVKEMSFKAVLGDLD